MKIGDYSHCIGCLFKKVLALAETYELNRNEIFIEFFNYNSTLPDFSNDSEERKKIFTQIAELETKIGNGMSKDDFLYDIDLISLHSDYVADKERAEIEKLLIMRGKTPTTNVTNKLAKDMINKNVKLLK